MGNVEFVKGNEIDSSKIKDDKARYHLKTAAELLMSELTPIRLLFLASISLEIFVHYVFEQV